MERGLYFRKQPYSYYFTRAREREREIEIWRSVKEIRSANFAFKLPTLLLFKTDQSQYEIKIKGIFNYKYISRCHLADNYFICFPQTTVQAVEILI